MGLEGFAYRRKVYESPAIKYSDIFGAISIELSNNRMNIKQLETFVRIVEHGSFANAASALQTTQSTVSARVKELERSIGTPLFDRTFHRAQLTPRGHELFASARQLVDFAASITSRFRDASAVSGLLRMGVVGVVANTWLPKLVAASRSRYPGVTLRLDMSLTRTLIERLRAGTLDVAIVAGPIAEPDFLAVSLGHDEFVWMASPKLRIPGKALGPRELQRWPILSLAEDSFHYPVIERWFRDGGAIFRSACSCNNMNVIAALTAAGQGVSLLPRNCYRHEIAAGRLRVLKASPPLAPVEFSVIYRADRHHPLTAPIARLAQEASELA
jgi:DNA-binding transcriptional LysR family regulator